MPEPIDVDEMQTSKIDDHEQRLRRLEDAFMKMTAQFELISKAARALVMNVGIGIGVDLTGVTI